MEKMNSSSNVSKSIASVCTVITRSELIKIISQKKEGDINILVSGDWHIASRSVDNRKILTTLNSMTSSSILKYTDSLIINGDLLDRRISLASEEASEFIEFSLCLLNRCREHGVSLDVLEGTPSHDNGQPALLTLFDRYSLDRDRVPLRYINRVSVVNLLQDHKKDYVNEHYGHDLKALYIPDEVSTDSQVTWSMVNEVLQLSGVDRVDMSYLHGMFRYQEPMFTTKSHSEENYESITNLRIIINHWHLSSAKGRIRAPGSPERLRHGEEETKGFYYCTISPSDDGPTIKEYFVINEDAVRFKTLDVSNKTLAEVYIILEDIFEKYPDSRIRLQLSRLDPLYPSLSEIKDKYKSLKITEKIIDTETSKEINLDLIDMDASFSIRPDNIHDLILEKIEDEPTKVKSRVSEIIGVPENVS